MIRRTRTIGWFMAALVSGACGDGPAEPGPGLPDAVGVDFGVPAGSAGAHAAAGLPGGDGGLLDGAFAVAARDSIGGLVVLSYDAETAGLFILQVSADVPGTYACAPVETGQPCHARYFENVRVGDGGVVEVDGRLDLTGGTLVLEGVGPARLEGTFEARLERTAGEGEPTVIDVTSGSISVELLAEGALQGGLDCLIALTGAGGPCGG